MMPSNPSDAGPSPRRRDPDSFECGNCRTGGQTRNSTYACQGCDTCQVRLCEDCRQQCSTCGLDMCPEHAIQMGDEKLCSDCVLTLTEDFLASQEDSEWLAMMSAAGLTLDELRASATRCAQ